MSTSKSFQNPPSSYLSYRPNSPKLTPNSPTSPTSPTSQTQHQTFTTVQPRTKQNSQLQPDHFASIRHENSMLREENKALKRELNLMKGEFLVSQNIGGHGHQVNDLRETIKKEAGEIKELKTRLEVVSKQCKMYEEIIDKMQGKINKLSEQNKNLETRLKQSKSPEKPQKQAHQDQPNKPSRQKFLHLVQKVTEITNLYIELESKVQLGEKEWEMWKDQWAKEKLYYLNRIRDLEGMMGIGVESKEFYKKRY